MCVSQARPLEKKSRANLEPRTTRENSRLWQRGTALHECTLGAMCWPHVETAPLPFPPSQQRAWDTVVIAFSPVLPLLRFCVPARDRRDAGHVRDVLLLGEILRPNPVPLLWVRSRIVPRSLRPFFLSPGLVPLQSYSVAPKTAQSVSPFARPRCLSPPLSQSQSDRSRRKSASR